MGQFPPDKHFSLPKSLQSKKHKKFLKAAFNIFEVKRLLQGTGRIINPSDKKHGIVSR